MPDPFIAAQDLTDILGKDVSADPGAIIALDAACDICRDIAEQSFNAATSTVSLDGSDSDVLILPEYPVTAAGTVVVNGGTVTDYNVTASGMLFRGTAGPYSTSHRWPRGRQNIVVTYDHGYAAIDLPRSVRVVALAIASRLIVQGVATREQVGDVTVDYAVAATDLTANEERILKKYRRVRSH